VKRIAFSLLSVVILIAMALPAGSGAVLAGGGDVDYIVISPYNAFIDGGGAETQAYSAEAFDAQENSLGDVTQDTSFTIEPGAGGSWEGCTYTSGHIGGWVVTGTHTTGKTGTAILLVLETPEYPGGSPDPPGGGASSSAPSGTTMEGESTPPVGGGSDPPHLEVEKSVSPETICIGDQATVTINVTGAGEGVGEHFPIDVMLVIDRSGSMRGTKLDNAKAAAKTFVGLLNSTNDQSGLVSFGCPWWGPVDARLDQNLTFDQSATNSSIDSLSAGAFTFTNIGEGIYEANAELIDNGRDRPPTIYAEVLLSDGVWNRGRDPVGAAQEAANNTIIIYTIGLGTDVDQTMMQSIANITGGKYYYAANSTDLEAIYQDIAGELSAMAGTDVVVTDVLPGDVNYVNGSAVPPPNSTSGQNLTWNWSSISIGDTKTITFNVTFNNTGYQPVGVYPDTRINYTDYLSNPASEAFPQINITVKAAPVANFTANNTNPCVNTSVNFTDLSTGEIDSWSWDVDGNGNEDYSTQNVTHTYTVAGTYNVSLNVTNECGSDIETKTNYVTVIGAAPTAAFSGAPTGGCAPLTVNFTDLSTGNPTGWSWDFPGGSPSSASTQGPHTVNYSSAGNYTVSLNVTNEYGSNITTKINYVVVNAKPTASASSNSPVCEGSTIELTGGPGGMTSYSWSGPLSYTSSEQSPSISNATTAMAGDYTLTVTDANGCSDDDTTDVVVNAKPTASASSNSPVCEGSTIDLTGGPGGMTSYSWSGPGGYTSGEQSPSISNATTAMAGDYTLTVTDANGCSDDDSTSVVVNAKPAASASSNTPVCEGSTIDLTGGPGGMTSYSWSGPLSYTSSEQSPSISNATTAMAGDYTLTVTDANGCSDDDTTNVVVNAKPTASASSNTPVCEGSTIDLTGGPGGMTSYSWSGPDGFTSGEQSPSISNATTAMAGDYTLTVTDANGCSDDDSTSVVVNAKPTASASSNSPVCEGSTIDLTGGPDGMTSYSWSGPLSYTSGAQSPSINNATTAMAGDYTLTVTAANGCSDDDTTNVVVNAKPTASASSNTPVCEGSTIDLTGGPDNMTSYSWSGPGGYTSGAQSPSISNATTAMAGDYTLTVTDANGCSDDDTTSVVVMVCLVTYNLTVTSDGCCPINVSGAASGTVSAGGSQTFLEIGEGGNVTLSADDSAVCCEFDSWSDAGAQTHTITMDSDKSVTANCSVPGPFTITATAGTNGNIAPSGDVSVDCGADQAFKITADSCYDIADVLVDNVSQGAVANYTFTNVTANHTISATFAIKTYTINATAGANGNIAPSGAVSVDCGADQTFNITADACYEIEDVVVDGFSVGAVANYTFINVTANHTISATFAIKTYTINATAGDNGSISPSGDVSVDCGADQTFDITADSCYDIADVLVDNVSQGAVANYTFTNVTANHTISATFAIKTYTITATAGTNGSISPSGDVSVDCGADQAFKITADACYEIEDVVVDGFSVGAVPSYTFINVTTNHTINATFAIKTYTITATAGANGNIAPSGAVSVACGASQTFNITADACYDIGDVVVDGSPVGAVASYTFTNVTANHTISATFAIRSYTINATAGANGNIAPSGAVSVACGASQTFNITADACYDIADVLVDNVSQGAVANYTFTNVIANHTISATFTIKTYTITATAGDNGSISPSGDVSVDCGADQAFNITADSCYDIADVLVDNVSQGAVANYTFTNVTANHTISATFAIKTYTINATAGDNGSISPSGDVSVDCGADQTFDITADSCYDIADVLVDNVSQGAVANYTFTNVTANHTISATFAIKTYTINATAGDNGSISPSGDVSVDCGADQTFDITADSCYDIADVLVDNVSQGAVANYTFTNVTANHTISATFAIKTYTITATAGTNGSISPSGDVSVDCGADQAFKITADSCYDIADVLVDNVSQGAVANYTFTNVIANHTISATFSEITCTLTVNVTPSGGGNVTVNGAIPSSYPNSTTWVCGDNVTLNAVVASGYSFDHWGGALSGNATPVNITMDSNKDVIAYFTHVGIHYNLTVDVSLGGSGDIEVNGAAPGSYPHSYTFNESELVNLTAVPAGGYCFVNWSGDLSGSVNPTDITMTSDKNVTAHFTPIYNLTVTSDGCCPINVSGAASGTVSAGGSQTFTGIGEGGNVTVSADDSAVCCGFDSWSDAGAQTHTITMDSNKSVTAYCSVPSYNLTVNVSPGGGGNVTVNGTTPSSYPNTTTWNCGDEVTVNAVAAGGYEFDHWSGNLSGSVNPTNITMDGDKSVTAHFSAVTYNLTVTSDGCCPINVSGAASGTVSAGGSETFTGIGEGGDVTVSADDSAVCCEFDSWSDAGAQTHNITMNSDKSVTANCSVPGYDLMVDVSPGGGNVTVNGVTPSGYPNTTTWTCGENVTVNAVAASGYTFVNWSGDLSGSVNPTNITMDGDKSVTANFEAHLPKICVDPGSLPLTVAPNTIVTATYTITNCGGGTLNWDSSNVTYDPNGNMSWLSQNITNGTLNASESDTVLVTVNTTGLAKGTTYNAFITITGSTFILPIILDVTEPTDIDVMRDLPGNNLLPDETYPGDTFTVYVNFTSPTADFNAISVVDQAPAGWTVDTNKTWCTPAADRAINRTTNVVEITWHGIYAKDTVFSAVYNVTVPNTAAPGINLFPLDDCDLAWAGYHLGADPVVGEYQSCVTGDFKMMITVPSDIVGETRDVNADLLTDVLVTLSEEPLEGGDEPEDSCSSAQPSAVYENAVDDTGWYWQRAEKWCYHTLDMDTMPGSRNPSYPIYINLTTPVLLADGYIIDFEGDYGLVPVACDVTYAMESVNKANFVPKDEYGAEHEEWQLTAWKAMESVDAWTHPQSCT